MRQVVELEIDGRDEPVKVTYTAVDLRRWEAWSHKSSLAERMDYTMLTYLGWSAAVRAGLIDGELKDWKKFDELCTDVKTINEDEAVEPRPTKKTRGGGSSAP